MFIWDRWYTIPSYHPYHVIPYHIPYHAISCHTISPSIPYHAIYHHTLPTPRHHMWMKNEALYWPWWWIPVILALGSPKQKMICSKLCFRNKRTITTTKNHENPKTNKWEKSQALWIDTTPHTAWLNAGPVWAYWTLCLWSSARFVWNRFWAEGCFHVSH